jgi:hypothetical protein
VTIRDRVGGPTIAGTIIAVLCVCGAAIAWMDPGAQGSTASTSVAGAQPVYVAVDGTNTGDGSKEHPIDLKTALSGNGIVKPGDTVWLRGGTYAGTFISELTGTAAAPIVVRQYPGERATIDSAPSLEPALYVKGAWTFYWGFEVTNSDPVRIIRETGSHPSVIKRGIGVDVHGPHTRFINLIVHDLAGGFGIWVDAEEAEAYGNIVYHNGWEADDRAHGHGIYTQNRIGTRRVAENIVFSQFSHGIHAYGSGAAFLDHITLTGNVVFNNGELDPKYFDRNILLGGERLAVSPVVEENFTYYSPRRRHGGENNFGYNAGCSNLVARGNYFAGTAEGAAPIKLTGHCGGSLTNNVFYGLLEPKIATEYPNNTYLVDRPSETVVFVRPNEYERGRANVIVYNWARLPELELDLSAAGLPRRASFELRDAENIFGPPVASGRFGSGRIKVRLRDLSIEPPVGSVPAPGPTHTAPEFAVFVLTARSNNDGNTMFETAVRQIRRAWQRVALFRR